MFTTNAAASLDAPALVAQGIEHRPPEAGAQVRILPGAPFRGPGHPVVRPGVRSATPASADAIGQCFRVVCCRFILAGQGPDTELQDRPAQPMEVHLAAE